MGFSTNTCFPARGGDSLFGVHLVRTAQVDDIDPRVGQRFLVAVAHRTGEAELVDQPLRAFPSAAADRDDFHMWILEPAFDMGVPHPAGPVNGNTQLPAVHHGLLGNWPLTQAVPRAASPVSRTGERG
jgi:hypothetical protein